MAEDLAAQIVATPLISDEFDEQRVERLTVHCYFTQRPTRGRSIPIPQLVVSMPLENSTHQGDTVPLRDVLADGWKIEGDIVPLRDVLADGWKIENQIRASLFHGGDAKTFLVLTRKKPRRAS